MFVYAWRLIVICDYPHTSILKISFWSFLSNTKKETNLPTPMYVHSRKISIIFRELRLLTLWPGALPVDPAGGCAPSDRPPVIGSRSRVRHGLKPPQSKFSGYIHAARCTFILCRYQNIDSGHILSLTLIRVVENAKRLSLVCMLLRLCALRLRCTVTWRLSKTVDRSRINVSVGHWRTA